MRVLLADRLTLVRESLACLIGAAGFTVVAQCASLKEVLAAVEHGKVDLALLDASVVGIEDLDGLLSASPGLKIALMTGSIARDQVAAVLRSGAKGVLPKTMASDAFLQSLRELSNGQEATPAAPQPYLGSQPDTPYALTRREFDVLRGLFAGKSNKEIGRDLELQEVTVKLHVKTLSRKLGAKNRTHATMIARNEGLV